MITKVSYRLYSVTTIVLLLSAVFTPRPGNVGIGLMALFEWLHVPVFGLVSLALLVLMPTSWRSWQRFGLSFLGATSLGVLTEAIQIPLSRDAAWEDIFSDAAGAAGFLLIAHAVSRQRIAAIVSTISAIAILVWSALPLIDVTNSIVNRNAQFPVIFNGDIELERAFVSGRNVQMITRQSGKIGAHHTEVQFIPGLRPGIEIRNLVSDWSDYSSLGVIIEVVGDSNLILTLRVHDKLHRRGNQPHEDRYNRTFDLKPGINKLSVSLQDIRSAPETRFMDMTKIEALILFSNKPESTPSINLYEIRLN